MLAIARRSASPVALNAVDHTRPVDGIDPGLYFMASTIVTLIGGTVFLMWLGEQITARGVGNGISLIIFAGIVAELPTSHLFNQVLEQARRSFIGCPGDRRAG